MHKRRGAFSSLAAAARAGVGVLAPLASILGVLLLGVAAPAAFAAPVEHLASAVAVRTRYFPALQHNVGDLEITVTSGRVVRADFLTRYESTGGLERWGQPTSEAFEESEDVLAKYFQRGVLDFRLARGLAPRLAWDHLGGGLSDGQDQGVEG
ncbi:MAG: hypothetical protein FJ029_06445 [Actinobacteria bacterium]|nr:hypothetical protein [Actinomycetota bacterium]